MTTCGMKSLPKLAVLSLVVFGIEPVTADLLRWNLQNVRFVDGGAASGFFVLDTAQSSFSDFDIKVTGGSYTPFEYLPQNSSGGYGTCTAPRQCVENFIGTQVGLSRVDPSGGPGRSLGFMLSSPATLTHPGSYLVNSTTARTPSASTVHTAPMPSYYAYASQEVDQNHIGAGPGDFIRWVRGGSLTTGAPQPPRHGALVTWVLDGVKFSDGGTATGSFVYDASNGTLVDFDIVGTGNRFGAAYNLDVPCGLPGPPCTLASVLSGQVPGTSVLSFRAGGSPSQEADLSLTAGGTLTDRGGILPLKSGELSSPYHGFHSALVAGSLIGTPVPEATQWSLFVFGLLTLIGLRRCGPGIPQRRRFLGASFVCYRFAVRPLRLVFLPFIRRLPAQSASLGAHVS
jgi:hypothetical protein